MTPDELSRLFAAERAVRSPAGPADPGIERLLSALTAQTPPLPVAVGSLQVASLFSKWVGLGFVVGIAVAGTAAQVWTEDVPQSRPALAVSSGAASQSVPVLARPAEARSSGSPSAAVPLAIPRSGSEKRREASRTTSAPSARPTFDEELRLIGAAKHELDRGRPHLAQAWLEEHRQRFSAGIFSVERDALATLARCDQRPQPDLALAFAAKHPESPMNAQLLRRCAKTAEDFSGPANVRSPAREPTQQ